MPSKPSPFKSVKPNVDRPISPESLFRDLRKKTVQYLWSHQADILREYEKIHKKHKDIALELPTGSGKTLIGLLIGEFRRKAYDERIAYLCPTRQLAFQVERLAYDYGITAHALVGPQKEYPQAKISDYLTSRAIAITTYSGLFNVNPRIEDPNVIILDDAHSADNYVSSLWTVTVERSGSFPLYKTAVNLLKGAIPPQTLIDIKNDKPPISTLNDIDCVPLPLSFQYLSALRDLLDQNLDENSKWSWANIRDHLEVCEIFISWRAITIKPFIPPTHTHKPFFGANQRVYMSATLGQGGEIERSMGITEAHSLPIPPGWDRQTTGRRFVLFPNLSLEIDQVNELIINAIQNQPRSLVLCPDNQTASQFEAVFTGQNDKIQIWKKEDIETSLKDFAQSNNSILVLTNRYDGIDLPGDDCRMEIIFGEPSATNPQEKFFLYRLGAHSLLKNRIRTRIAQALGRCVRSANDYAAVLIIGNDVANFLAMKENLAAFHPEMQAELHFGRDNSMEQTRETFDEMLRIFQEQSQDWQQVEKDILALRDTKERIVDSSISQLDKTAKIEVLFSRSFWSKNFEDAQVHAQQILDLLNGDELLPYRGWWYYLAGCVAWLRFKTENDQLAFRLSQDHFSRAAKTAMSIKWLIALSKLKDDQVSIKENDDETEAGVIENIYVELTRTPLQGGRFEKGMKLFLANIINDESNHFENGLLSLGQMLGFSSERPEGDGTPDSVWYIGNKYVVTFEAKSSQKSEGVIGKADVQQANGHKNWIQANRPGQKGETCSVLTSIRNTISQDALPHTGDLYYLSIESVRHKANEIVEMYRKVRAISTESSPEKVKMEIARELHDRNLSPKNIYLWLSSEPIKNLPT